MAACGGWGDVVSIASDHFLEERVGFHADRPDHVIGVRAGWATRETVHSHVSRIWFLLGSRPSAVFRRQIFGPSPRHMSVTMPGNLEHLARVLPPGGPDLDALIERHTLFPYHAAFMTDEARLRLAEMLAFGWVSGVQGWMGSRRAAVPKQTYLACCPTCVREHLPELGAPAWICDHQLPAVEVCHRHGDRLRLGPWETGHVARLQPCPENTWEYPRVPALLPAGLAMRFARASAALLERPRRFPPADRVHAAMAQLIAENGFVRHGRIQRRDLEEFVRGQLGVEAMDAFGMVDVVGLRPRLLHVLHEKRAKSFSPTCRYLLLLTLLERSVDDLWQAASDPTPPVPSTRTGPTPRPCAKEATILRHRETILRAVAEHQDWTRVDLFHNVRAAYSTITRDDREWWEANAPAPNRVVRRLDYALRDRKQAAQIRAVIQRLRALSGTEAVITKRTVLREAGLPIALRPTPRLSPMTLAALLEALNLGNGNPHRRARGPASQPGGNLR